MGVVWKLGACLPPSPLTSTTVFVFYNLPNTVGGLKYLTALQLSWRSDRHTNMKTGESP